MLANRSGRAGHPLLELRAVLGARPRQVVGMVLRRGFTTATVGIVVGTIGAAGAANALEGFLYGIAATDPLAWLTAVATVLGICLLAHALPARRAAAVNPVDSLRAE